MCGAGIAVCLVALWAARGDVARARGLDKVVALGNLCFAIPLAVFGALHLADIGMVLGAVPAYMPWKAFWAYLVGFALVAAALSIATKIQVRSSGLLFGVMLFLFAAMTDVPGAIANPGDRFGWTFVVRELAFSSGGLLLAAGAIDGVWRKRFVVAGRVVLGVAAVFYGVEHFLHPLACPGVPLEKLMPDWIPGRLAIGYVTGAILLACGALILAARKTRLAATILGGWIVLLVVVVYGPILVAQLGDPSLAAEIEGINYFADTLLFGGAMLALAGVQEDSVTRVRVS
jgi:uncharacterized membrane protein